jgi:hypothetical protein
MATADAGSESLATNCPEKDSTPYERIVLEPPPNLEKEIEEAKGTEIYRGIFLTLLHLPPLRFHCVGGCLDRTRRQLRLRHWLSDSLTARLDLIHSTARSHPQLS